MNYSIFSIKTAFAFACLAMVSTANAQLHFDMTQKQPVYCDAAGYGYDVLPAPQKTGEPFFFSAKLPDGNYKVTVELGAKKMKGCTVVRAESRRLMVRETATAKGKFKKVEFVVNKRSPFISDKMNVRIKEREKNYLNWDDRLTLEFNGSCPTVKSISIEPDTTAVTLFLCGNSTVVDQNEEPYASWGQMIPCWFNPGVAISNHAESGLSAATFLGSNRLDKVLAMMRKGDYVFCEFGHNDQKEHRPGDGAWYSFQYNLKRFIDLVREKGGHIIFVTPTQRRAWDSTNTHIIETHGDYPDAMRDVAKRENVPLIELHDMTRTFFETLGFENSKKSLVHYPAGTFAGQTKDLADNTHFNPYGAYEVAKMMVMGMKSIGLPVTQFLREDWSDFDPAKPDDFNHFVWYPSPLNNTTKPDGN